jgi:light-harvesting complex 1 beta chain
VTQGNIMASTAKGSLEGIVGKDSKAFYAIFAVGFAVFLMIAVTAQIVGLQWRSWLPGAEGVKSMTGSVKAAVYTFMSYLT